MACAAYFLPFRLRVERVNGAEPVPD